MNKTEFIEYMSKLSGVDKSIARQTIEVMIDTIKRVLAEEGEINLIGFGRFYASQVEAREGRNPSTGKSMQIAAYKHPRFSAGSKLKVACNPRKDISGKTKKK